MKPSNEELLKQTQILQNILEEDFLPFMDGKPVICIVNALASVLANLTVATAMKQSHKEKESVIEMIQLIPLFVQRKVAIILSEMVFSVKENSVES